MTEINLLIGKLFDDIIPLANSSMSKDDFILKFKETALNVFGVEKADIVSINEKGESKLYEYITNTKTPYIDNQLSSYSTFSELIEAFNSGYKSYVGIPIIANGRVVAIFEMLSKYESKFNTQIVNLALIASYFAGYVIVYKIETEKSARLASYFSAAFDSGIPTILANKNGTVVKTNEATLREFEVLKEGASISEINVQAEEIQSALKSGLEKAIGNNIYYISANDINENLEILFFNKATDSKLKNGLLSLFESESDESLLILNEKTHKIEYASANVDKVLGQPSEFLAEGKLENLMEESIGQKFSQSLDYENGTKDIGEYYINANGKKRYLHIYASRGYGKILLLLKNNDMAVNTSKLVNNFYDLANVSSDPIFIVDELGFIKYCNMSVENILGYPKDELIGKEIKTIYEDINILDRDFGYIKNGNKIDNSYVVLIKKDQSKLSAIYSIREIEKVNSQTYYMFLIKELETKRRLNDMELELKRQTNISNRLRSISDLKSQFIYNISHELKSPLTSIIGYAKFLINGEFGELNDEQKGYIKTIIDESNRLMLIIQQVLDASKLDANKIKLEINEIDFRELEDTSSIKAIKGNAIAKGLFFKWTVDYNVPKIMADQNRIIQVLVNLISNAIKFTDKGGITVHTFRKTKKYIECDVIDTGVGISPEDKKKLFREFYQATTRKDLTSPPKSGTGLGLSIAKKIILLHKGKIGVESELGKGSKFFFILPINGSDTKQRKKQNDEATAPQ
ncbi:MAG: ATP-binding protein [Candidatus Micrarchaeia archaeon]